MNTRTFAPPQAYTRDTLVKAYEWLKTQPPIVKDRATSADALVSLFLHARRHLNERRGLNEEMDSAPSVESFKSDLKNLAEGLKQFEMPVNQNEQNAMNLNGANSTPAPSAHQPPHGLMDYDVMPPSPPQTVMHFTPPPSPPHAVIAPVPQVAVAPPAPKKDAHSLTLDFRSHEIVRDIQRRLNLGAEEEALRLLITAGYDRLKTSWLPNGL